MLSGKRRANDEGVRQVVFSSTVFLFIFLPVVWIAHMLIPPKMLWLRNALLAVASLVFYAYGEPVYIVVMIASVTVNYFAALIISKLSGKARSAVCALAVIIDIAALCFFKYVPWLVRVIDSAAGLSIPVPGFTIPVGISFYTFQILSYVVDVNSGKTEVQKSFGALFLYISFFPQLIAGPIVKYGDICAQLSSREVTVERTSLGIRRFIFGLSKKVLVSNTAAILAKAAFEASTPSSLMAWSGAIAYCIQLYFDFSGYSDMAIGLGKMFGFTFIENFRLPYTATSIQDFWRKWHISLSSWFKEYVYIPLGGNRRGTARTYVNLWTVFLLTGIWHGAGWTFIFWGVYHGFFNVLERCFLGKWLKQEKFRPLAHIYAVFVVLIGWIFFRADTIGQAFSFIRYMFVPHSAVVLMERYMNRKLWMFLAAALLACGPVQWFWMKWKGRVLVQDDSVTVASWIGYMAILWFSILLLVNNTYNPFIYFRF